MPGKAPTPGPAPAALRRGRPALALLALLGAAVFLGALSAVAFVRHVLPALPADWSAAVLHRGAGKVMSRMLQLWLVLLLPLGLRWSGWAGWRDCGWQRAPAGGRPAWQDVVAGLALGVATLGSLAVFMWLTGRRVPAPLDVARVPLALLLFPLSAVAVALFEETLARGIIFRVWARSWGAAAAALVSSLLFAAAHFVSPADAAFTVPGFGPAVGALCSSTLRLDTADAAFWIRFLNLAFLGLALCAMVRLTGSVWLAVGAHAGWVWIIKLNNFFTDAVPPALRSRIWGARGDLTDSAIGTATLLAVLLVVLWRIGRQTRRGSPA